MKALITAMGLAFSAGAVMADTPILTVYTYDSFVTDWGPGPQVEAAFEATCACDLHLVGVGDGAAVLARLRLEGVRSDADVVVGLDTNLTHAAAATGLFTNHGVNVEGLTLPIPWQDDVFLPFDWGYFAFVHRTDLALVPHDFITLGQSNVRILIQDPRSSTPGLGLLMWVEAAYGDRAGEVWQNLADNIVTVTPGWSESYTLFLEGEADMVLSYTTSPAYHRIAEGDDGFAAAPFAEGHYTQIEVMGILDHSDQPDLAQQFVAFMLSQTAQAILPTTNWMYPAALPRAALPDGFDTFPRPNTTLLFSPEQAANLRNDALSTWQAAFGP